MGSANVSKRKARVLEYEAKNWNKRSVVWLPSIQICNKIFCQKYNLYNGGDLKDLKHVIKISEMDIF